MSDTRDPFLQLLREARLAGASDLILSAGSPPSIYQGGRLQPLAREPLPAARLHEVIRGALDEAQRQRLEQQRDLDFSLADTGLGRCRVNVHYQRQSLAAAVRFVPNMIPTLSELGLSEHLGQLVELTRGLVLVTGGTGSGKSTTLAALLDRVNHSRAAHIITLEDPIEYSFTNDRSIVEQREIGEDAPSFASALRHVVRQKPDVILIGEMRDLETIATALTAAETGHLVLASLHTITAAQTVERIVDVFDARQQAQVRVQLANTLRAIVCQTLLPSTQAPAPREGKPATSPQDFSRTTGLVPALEILIATPAIRRAIRDGETHLIPGMIETGSKWGMRTLDASLADHVREGRVQRAEALALAADPEKLERLVGAPPMAKPVERMPVPTTSTGPRKPWE